MFFPRQNRTCWPTRRTAWPRRASRSATWTTWSWGRSWPTSWPSSAWTTSSRPTATCWPRPSSAASSARPPRTCWGTTRRAIASGPGPACATAGSSTSPGFSRRTMRKPRWVEPVLVVEWNECLAFWSFFFLSGFLCGWYGYGGLVGWLALERHAVFSKCCKKFHQC